MGGIGSEGNQKWKLVRDVVLFGAAVFMLIHETLSQQPNERVLAAALLMLGLPVAFRIDAARRNGGG